MALLHKLLHRTAVSESIRKKLRSMKTPNVLRTDIPADIRKKYLDSDAFREDLILQNIRRGKHLAILIIAIEAIFVLADIITLLLQVSQTFSFYSYLAMYVFMIAVNLAYLFLIDRYQKGKRIRMRTMHTVIVLYVTVIMVWGGVITLMDQRLYGHTTAFMVNMVVCSILYLMDNKPMLIPYLVSYSTLAIGLPFFQHSSNVLVGHYLNSAVFLIISWAASRICYHIYCDNYVNRALMKNSNTLLEKEMQENRLVNEKLACANAQLKKLALVDELTGLSNRRGFREFIDQMVQNNPDGSTVSMIMMDIDYFKQYNDCYGHEKGDMALIAVAQQTKNMLESADQIAVRWGGEEFLFAAFNVSRERTVEIAEAIRRNVLYLAILNKSSSLSPYLTVSLGTCTGTITSAKDISRILNTADKALYRAKNSGRNRVVTLEADESSDGENL